MYKESSLSQRTGDTNAVSNLPFSGSCDAADAREVLPPSHPGGLPRRPRDAAATRLPRAGAATQDGADAGGSQRSPPGAGPALAERRAASLETRFSWGVKNLPAFQKPARRNSPRQKRPLTPGRPRSRRWDTCGSR